MIIEVNGHIIDISQINWIGPVHGIREHNWFKFSVNGKEFEWEAQYRDAIVKPYLLYHDWLTPVTTDISEHNSVEIDE